MKKSKLYAGCDFVTLMEVHNPFGIKANDGAVHFFNNYAEIYLYVLDVLSRNFDRGYVDYILLVSTLTGLRVGDCEDCYKQVRSMWGPTPERLFDFNWGHLDPSKEDDAIADIFKCLHTITETKFDPYQYVKAKQLFVVKLAKEGRL